MNRGKRIILKEQELKLKKKSIRNFGHLYHEEKDLFKYIYSKRGILKKIE